MAHQVKEMTRDVCWIQGEHSSTFIGRKMSVNNSLSVFVCVFPALCVSDITAPLRWAGITPGCSKHIHIN